jgi:hypothetical protein
MFTGDGEAASTKRRAGTIRLTRATIGAADRSSVREIVIGFDSDSGYFKSNPIVPN